MNSIRISDFAASLCIFFIQQFLHAQPIQNGGPIPVSNVSVKEITRQPASVSQTPFDYFFHWSGIQSLTFREVGEASLFLEAFKTGQTMRAYNFGFTVPQGSEIEEIIVGLDGRSEGKGCVNEVLISLTGMDGKVIGLNQAGKSNSKNEWSMQGNRKWSYGGKLSKWGISADAAMVNSPQFGVAIQLSNNLSEESFNAIIRNLSIRIKYREPYRICPNEMASFVQLQHHSHASYHWKIPSGYRLVSPSLALNVIHIRNVNAKPGSHEICIDITGKNAQVQQFCTSFILDTCTPLSIGDFVWNDKNANGIQDANEMGIPGVGIQLFNEKGQLLKSTISDLDGKYSFQSIAPGKYFIKVELPEEFLFTSALEPHPNINSVITGAMGMGTSDLFTVEYTSRPDIDIGLTSRLSIEGSVWEDINANGLWEEGEPPIQGITVRLLTPEGLLTETVTNIQGGYVFDHLKSHTYAVEFVLPDGFYPTVFMADQPEVASLVQSNFRTKWYCPADGPFPVLNGGFFKKGVIGDFIWHDLNRNGIQDDGEPGLHGVDIYLIDETGSEVFDTQSDENGFYQFIADPGIWSIKVAIPDDFEATVTQAGQDSLIDSDGIENELFVMSAPVLILSGEMRFDIDFGFISKLSSLSGLAWYDENANGIIDGGEPGRLGIKVKLFNQDGSAIDSVLTDGSGSFQFQFLQPGTYQVQFDNPENDFFTLPDIGAAMNSVVNDQGISPQIHLMPGEESDGWNAGYVRPASISGLVWLDRNRNGLFDSEDSALPEVSVFLFTEDNILVDEVFSGNAVSPLNEGKYSFSRVFPGEYFIEFLPDQSFIPANRIEGQPGQVSSIVTVDPPFITEIFKVNPGENLDDINGGFMLPGGDISGTVWEDINGDGVKQIDEPLLQGIEINLKDIEGVLVEAMISDSSGIYYFQSIPAGFYTLEITIPDTLELTKFGDGVDNVFIRENGFGTSTIFELKEGEWLINKDAGFIGVREITGILWFDINQNGLLEAEESGLNEVEVLLHHLDGTVFAATTTLNDGISDGRYVFERIPFGTYYLSFGLGENYIITQALIGGDPAIHSKITDANGPFTTQEFKVPDEYPHIINGGVIRTANLSGLTWLDENQNGLKEENEPLLEDVLVGLFSENGDLLLETQTGINGAFQFDKVLPGRYFIQMDPGPGLAPTLPNVGNQKDIISVLTGDFSLFSSSLFEVSGEDVLYLNGGFVEDIPRISGRVWMDSNGNGILDEEEEGENGVTVILFTTNHTEVARTETSTLDGKSGRYEFRDIDEGFYYLSFLPDPSFIFTMPKVGNDDTIDSDVTEENGFNTTYTFEFPGNTTHINAGLLRLNSLSGMVWLDENEDGTRQMEENGLNGVLVLIKDATGLEIGRTNTMTIGHLEGAYRFSTVPNGIYYLEFRPGPGFEATIPLIGDDPLLNSDITNEKGPLTTSLFILDRDTMGINAGLILQSDMASGRDKSYDSQNAFITDTSPSEYFSLISAEHEIKPDTQAIILGKMSWQQPDNRSFLTVDFTSIYLELYDHEMQYLQGIQVDEYGKFIFNGLKPGNYHLKISPNHSFQWKEVSKKILLNQSLFELEWIISPLDDSLKPPFEISLTPNLVSEYTFVTFDHAKGPVFMQVLDTQGKVLKEIKVQYGVHDPLRLETGRYLPGTYFIRAINNNEVSVARMVKVY
ncbi:MAG TPA: SdrD B-like domain-containing protein [Saprospiraceae bacterium]|nr:SdrD B-like domain-containing protein [Saprospiraceae bacterium]